MRRFLLSTSWRFAAVTDFDPLNDAAHA